MITEIRHTGIVVNDLEKMIEFYEQLGFKIKNRQIESGEFIDKVTGLKGVKLEWAKLMPKKNNSMIELLKYHSHNISKKKNKQKSNQYGCSHIAFTVNNIDNMISRILNKGGSIVNESSISPDTKAKVSYCHDPEGNLMEIVEVIK